MPLNMDKPTEPHEKPDGLSNKARETLQVLRRFRMSHAPDPVFRSVRSRPLESQIVTD